MYSPARRVKTSALQSTSVVQPEARSHSNGSTLMTFMPENECPSSKLTDGLTSPTDNPAWQDAISGMSSRCDRFPNDGRHKKRTYVILERITSPNQNFLKPRRVILMIFLQYQQYNLPQIIATMFSKNTRDSMLQYTGNNNVPKSQQLSIFETSVIFIQSTKYNCHKPSNCNLPKNQQLNNSNILTTVIFLIASSCSLFRMLKCQKL